MRAWWKPPLGSGCSRLRSPPRMGTTPPAALITSDGNTSCFFSAAAADVDAVLHWSLPKTGEEATHRCLGCNKCFVLKQFNFKFNSSNKKTKTSSS